MRLLSVRHNLQGLSAVESAQRQLETLPTGIITDPSIHGALVLRTCNRLEILLDVDSQLAESSFAALIEAELPNVAWDVMSHETSIEHLFQVAAGMDSMVLGEREIAGQLRRALGEAQDAGQASSALVLCVELALKTSRKVARETKLASAGRTLVRTGLDTLGFEDWSNIRVLLVGTGSYAGAVVAALHRRGVEHLAVHSVSGRESFAQSHGLPAVSLADGLLASDLVITCRGQGRPVIDAALLEPAAHPAHFLDLSLLPDVAADVADLAQLINLPKLQEILAPTIEADNARAAELVAAGISEVHSRLRAKRIDPAMVGLREVMMTMVEDEVSRLPDRTLTTEDVSYSLRRLATRLLHIPSARAKLAAENDRTEEYLQAMVELYGIGTPDPDTLVEHRCPVTNFTVEDLTAGSQMEGM